MAQKKKPAKDRVKAKAKEVKAKVKGKVKALLALVGLAVLTGCMTPEQASRSTAATVGDVSIENSIAEIKGSPRGSADKACACADKCACAGTASATPLISIVSKITFGDMALASADSAGSTESQAQTPTFDISPKTDLRYNDAIAGATTASKGVLSAIGYGADAVLEMMASKKSGTVKVQKTDGTDATVKCENGQCSFCEDGNCSADAAK